MWTFTFDNIQNHFQRYCSAPHGEQQRDFLRKTNVNYIYIIWHMNLQKCTQLCFIIRNGKRGQKESAAPSSWSSSLWALASMWLATLISSDHILIRSWKQKRQNEIILGIFISLVLNTASWWKCNLSLTIKRLKGLTQIQTYHIPNIFCLFYNVYRANKCFIVELCF